MNTVERISKFESILSIPDMDMRSLVSAKMMFGTCVMSTADITSIFG